MAKLIQLTTFSEAKGNLTVIEKVLPFDVKRVFYIYGVDDSVRGKHRHHSTIQAIICIQGSCRIYLDDGEKEETIFLSKPDQCLIVLPKDWHSMREFTPDAILLVIASENFDRTDYIFEPYK